MTCRLRWGVRYLRDARPAWTQPRSTRCDSRVRRLLKDGYNRVCVYGAGPTTNPYDVGATPGGSSSGSAAAVGAGMVPAALGNQVVGSVIRPAGYCANVAMKPTGALHGGEGLSLSQLHVGVHAASLEDMWAVAYEIGNRAGGDPGYPACTAQQIGALRKASYLDRHGDRRVERT